MILTTLLHTTLATGALMPAISPNHAFDRHEVSANSGIAWHAGSFSDALKVAGKNKQKVFVYLWTESSEMCTKFQSDAMARGDVIGAINEYVPFGANVVNPDGAELVKRYNVQVLPTMLIVTSEGALEDAVVGFIEGDKFLGEMKRIKQGKDTVSDFRARVKKNPKDLDLHYQFCIKLSDVGDYDGYEEAAKALKKKDPYGKDKNVARLVMDDLKKELALMGMDDHGQFTRPEIVDLKPMYTHLRKVKHGDLAFEGWMWAGAIERMREDYATARECAMKAWPHCPEEKSMKWANEVAYGFYEMREDLDAKEKKFALELAQKAASLVAAYEKDFKACGCYDECDCEQPSEGEAKAAFNTFAAGYFNTLSACYFMNNDKDSAIASGLKAVELAPEVEEFQAQLAVYKGEK